MYKKNHECWYNKTIRSYSITIGIALYSNQLITKPVSELCNKRWTMKSIDYL